MGYIASIRKYPIAGIFNDTRGVVVVSTLMIITALLLLGAIAISTTTTEMTISANYRIMTQALFAAEAGVYTLIANYRNDPSLYTTATSASDLELPTARPARVNIGTSAAYWFDSLTYEASNPPQYVDIESRGTVVGTPSLAKVGTRVKHVLESPFDFGIFGDKKVSIVGEGQIDSYDACAGPYDPSLRHDQVVVGTNATGAQAIGMYGIPVINGDAVVGPGGDPTTDISGGTVAGTKSAATHAKELSPPSAPEDAAPLTLEMGDYAIHALTDGTYHLPEISLKGESALHIDGNVTLHVDGDINIAGLAEIDILPGSSLTIYASGSTTIAGNGIINHTNLPKNLLIYGTPSSSSIYLRGTADFFGAIYAPTADVISAGASQIYGAVVGKTVQTVGTSDFHYDECLGRIGEHVFRVTSWRID